MSGRLISVPSLKFKKKKRPSRTQSQMAPLASYDEFQLSDYSDNEEAHGKTTPDSAPLPRLKHHYSTDDAATRTPRISRDQVVNSTSEIEEVVEVVEEAICDENINQQTIKTNEKGVEETTEDDDLKDYENLDDNGDANQVPINNNEEEHGEVVDDGSECEKMDEENGDYGDIKEEEEELEEEEKEFEEEEEEEEGEREDEDDPAVEGEIYCQEEIFDNIENGENDVIESFNEGPAIEIATPSDFSGVATEPNTPNDYDQSMEEYSEKAEDATDCIYQKEEYYSHEEEPVVDAGDDPFSIDYQQSRKTDTYPSYENKDPPQIVITEPSDTDLPSIDTSKPTKPSRPPEPSKGANIPKRPPPPSSVKAPDVELRKIPPPPSSSKRRNKQNDDDLDLSKKTKFPFKSHFEKKHLVPNPKKAILNVLKGESKKERKKRKAEEEFDKILNSVDPEDAPICESTDEWKAYKEFQERIGASVQLTQQKIKNILAEDSELSEGISEKDEGDKENKDWTNFEDRIPKTSSVNNDLESILMAAVENHKVYEDDIWGCEVATKVDEPIVNFDSDFDIVQTTFDQTFSTRIDETEEEEVDATEAFFTERVNTTQDDLFSGFNDIFAADLEKDSKTQIVVDLTVDPSTVVTPRRPKPQRQETLSGNNPFRKASLGEEIISDKIEMEEESPFLVALKAAGVVDLEQEPAGFDPLTTIYPDSGDESEVVEDKDVNSESSDSNDDDLLNFKNKVTILDPSEIIEKDEMVSVLNTPIVPSGAKGPRERKLPPEPKSSKKEIVDTDLDDLFSDLRVENDKDLLDVAANEEIITFDSPLSGNFATQQVEWEAFPSNKGASDPGEEMVWGKETPFKAEFEPLPHEIITFEPFNEKNEGSEWKLLVRQPEKKSKAKQISRYTSNRWWKEVYVTLVHEKDRPCLKFYENLEDAEPYRVVRIEPYMQLSQDKLQQYDKYGKLHIFKINHIVYKEMVGMRTEKFSIKTLHNLVSHKPKMNIMLDHMPLRTEIVKFGSLDKKSVRNLMSAIEDSMMSIKTHRDTSLEYTKEEVCCYVNDEYVCELSSEGSILSQKARTRILFAAFVTGNPYIVLGINDKWRFGNEVVRRQDIIPIMHDDWISIYEPEFHLCIDMEEYEKDHMIKFYPLDGCRFELMRFRVPLRPNKELPLVADVKIKINGARVDIRIDLSVPGFFSASKRHGAVHCDDIEIRVPIPEEWAYHFRIEKHTKYGSVHSSLRKPGKIKGFERITQLAQSFLPASMLEASAGVAKYEHLYRAVVWRIPRSPEKNEASYKPHMMTCKFILAPHDTVPSLEELSKTFHVEYKMSASTVSGATVRSISVEHTSTPDRFVKYLARYKYTRAIRYELGDIKPPPIKSILDQPPEIADEAQSSDESHHEKSSLSETGNSSPSRSNCNASVDLLSTNLDLDSHVSLIGPPSAMDDLLTLDGFIPPCSNDENVTDANIANHQTLTE